MKKFLNSTLMRVSAAALVISAMSIQAAAAPRELSMEPSGVLYGDVNSDGKVDINDLTHLRRYFANFDPINKTSSVSINAGADVNVDGSVDLNDLTVLRRYFANFNPLTGESSLILGTRQ